jgi:hypothetical protein
VTPLISAALIAAQPAETPVAEMSCEAIGAEIGALVRSTLSGTREQIRLAELGQRTIADEAMSQVGGLVTGLTPAPASGIAARVLGTVTHARDMQLQREGLAAQRRMDEIDVGQEGVTERIGLLHEEHQSRCRTGQAR